MRGGGGSSLLEETDPIGRVIAPRSTSNVVYELTTLVSTVDALNIESGEQGTIR